MTFLRRLAKSILPVTLGASALAGILALPARPLLAQSVAPAEYGLKNNGLIAVGRIPARQRDKFNETTISGSGMAMDLKAWRRTADGYRGVLYLLPDRGYNVSGTIDFQPRIHKLSIMLNSASVPPSKMPRRNGVVEALLDTIKLTDAAGAPLTGLDPVENGVRPRGERFSRSPAGPQWPHQS